MAEVVELREAVAGLVRDGDSVALEGFTRLIPNAAAHEIIRQEKQDLALIPMTPDLIYDQMIGMGCARKLIFSWGGNPARRPKEEYGRLPYNRVPIGGIGGTHPDDAPVRDAPSQRRPLRVGDDVHRGRAGLRHGR